MPLMIKRICADNLFFYFFFPHSAGEALKEKLTIPIAIGIKRDSKFLSLLFPLMENPSYRQGKIHKKIKAIRNVTFI